jgi:WD40 repeat protein
MNMETKKYISELHGNSRPLSSTALSSNTILFASGDKSGVIKVWDLSKINKE